MPHNRHIKAVREYQSAQMAHQEEELAALALKLHSEWAKPTVLPFIDESKEHRRVRLEQNRRHKPVRLSAAGTTQA